MQRLIARHEARDKPFDEYFEGVRLRITPGVFCPTFTNTTRLLARNMRVRPNDRVLDVCTGSGVLGILAAMRGATVVCSDVLPDAVACARSNASTNGVASRVDVRIGDLFTSVAKDRFDLIVCNPPLLQGSPVSKLEGALFDPGLQITRRFVTQAFEHLTPGGRALLLTTRSTLRGEEIDLDALCWDARLTRSITATLDVGYETYIVNKLQPADDRRPGAPPKRAMGCDE